MYLVKRFIAPAILLFINRYSQATAHHSPIIYLQLKLSVRIHKEASATFTCSVILCLHSLISLRFDCIDHHQHFFIPSSCLPCRPNQSRIIWRSAQILLCWVFGNLDALVLLYIGFNIRRTIILAVICII